MEKYIVKNNLPEGIVQNGSLTGKSRYMAVRRFLTIANQLNASGYNTKMNLRNKKDKPARGTIQVEIDGFYYYVELFKTEY